MGPTITAATSDAAASVVESVRGGMSDRGDAKTTRPRQGRASARASRSPMATTGNTRCGTPSRPECNAAAAASSSVAPPAELCDSPPRASRRGSSDTSISSEGSGSQRAPSVRADKLTVRSKVRKATHDEQRYRTELCHKFTETGYCPYGDRCQFAHGAEQLRQVARHPKYKTEPCASFWSTGLCAYGPRCRFMHRELSDDSKAVFERIAAPARLDVDDIVSMIDVDAALPRTLFSAHGL